MIGSVRATMICATLALGLTAAGAADKAFKRDELADSAVKLEAQIKSEAGPVAKSSATLRSDAPLFDDVERLRWRGPTEAFPAVAAQIGDAKLLERCERAAQQL